jgi:hypothetical protein
MSDCHMPSIKWRLKDLFLLTFAAAIAFAAYREFWDSANTWDAWPNYRILFTLYLATLSIATLGAFWGRPSLRGFFAGYALFCWMHLATTLQGGFIGSDSMGRVLVQGSALGAMVGVISGIITHWVIAGKPKRSDGK